MKWSERLEHVKLRKSTLSSNRWKQPKHHMKKQKEKNNQFTQKTIINNNLFVFCRQINPKLIWLCDSFNSFIWFELLEFEQIAIEMNGEKKAHFYFVFRFHSNDSTANQTHQTQNQFPMVMIMTCVRVSVSAHNPPLTLIHCFRRSKKKIYSMVTQCLQLLFFSLFSSLRICWTIYAVAAVGAAVAAVICLTSAFPLDGYWFQWITYAHSYSQSHRSCSEAAILIGAKWKSRKKKSHREYNEAFPSSCWPPFWPTSAQSASLRSNVQNEIRVISIGRVGRWNRFWLKPLICICIIMTCQLMDDVTPDEWRMRKTKVQPFWMEIFFDLQFVMWFHIADVVRIATKKAPLSMFGLRYVCHRSTNKTVQHARRKRFPPISGS